MDVTSLEKRQRLVNALISARKSSSMRQIDVARELGKPQSFVSKYETRQRHLSMEELIAVCRILGVSPLTLMVEAGLITDDELT